MRQSIRGWRSARVARGNAPAPARAQVLASPSLAGTFPSIPQEPLRLGLGLVALGFYLWLIHSYKLAAGDVAVVGLGIGVLLRGGSLRFPAPMLFFLLFIIWNAVGLSETMSTAVTSDAIINLGKLWIITFCVMNVVRSAAEFRFLAIGWLALFALYPVRGALFNQYICHCTEFGRVGWNFVFENPNDLAALSLVPLGLAAGVATVERVKYFRWAALTGVVVLAMLVMLTQSRGAILALGAAAIMLPMTSRRKARDFMLLAGLFGMAAVFAPKDVWQRLAGLTNASVEGGMAGVDKEGSAEARWQVWQIAARTVKQHPLLGVGAGMMPATHQLVALSENRNWEVRGARDTHSTFLRIAAETGFPGLLLYLLMWGSVFWRLRAVRKALARARPKDHQFLFYLELSLMAFLVASIFGTYGALSFTYLTVAVAWLAALILERETWYTSGAPVLQPAPVAGFRRSR